MENIKLAICVLIVAVVIISVLAYKIKKGRGKGFAKRGGGDGGIDSNARYKKRN